MNATTRPTPQAQSPRKRVWPRSLRTARMVFGHWAATDGLIWLHLAKTLLAAFLAMGIAMKLEMAQPRTAMATVFVLMQPQSGMVLAKSFYRVLGTAAGAIAAVLLGALFPQQAGLYLTGMAIWVALCTAAALRYRNFQWYAFVLAGYTAALIGIPYVLEPNALLMGALTRASEVMLGIVCSGAVSAIVLPKWASTDLKHMRRERYARFSSFAARVLRGEIDGPTFKARFGDFVDSVVRFEATRSSATFEDPEIRSRMRRLARLNSEFMDLCSRLHAMHGFVLRLEQSSKAVAERIVPLMRECAQCIEVMANPALIDEAFVNGHVAAIIAFETRLRDEVSRLRAALTVETSADAMLDFDTAIELLDALVAEYIRYSQTYVSLAYRTHALESHTVQYVVRANRFGVLFTFIRTAIALGGIGAFWLASEWPAGGLAMIGAAIVAALASNAGNPAKYAVQMAGGAACATVAGYVVLRHVYPMIDGFPLLCVVLTPILGLGAFLATRPKIAGFGVSFSLFFCIIAGPDNMTHYAPETLINGGMAVTLSMLICALVFAVVFPPQMPWRIASLIDDLKRQVRVACFGSLKGLNQVFQSSTHDLMSQLGVTLPRHTNGYADALAWMLVVLEVGHAAIDIRTETEAVHRVLAIRPEWREATEETLTSVTTLFDVPSHTALLRCVNAIDRQIEFARRLLAGVLFEDPAQASAQANTRSADATDMAHATDTVQASKRHHMLRGERVRAAFHVRRTLACLNFMRSTLTHQDAPFDVTGGR